MLLVIFLQYNLIKNIHLMQKISDTMSYASFWYFLKNLSKNHWISETNLTIHFKNPKFFQEFEIYKTEFVIEFTNKQIYDTSKT